MPAETQPFTRALKVRLNFFTFGPALRGFGTDQHLGVNASCAGLLTLTPLQYRAPIVALAFECGGVVPAGSKNKRRPA